MNSIPMIVKRSHDRLCLCFPRRGLFGRALNVYMSTTQALTLGDLLQRKAIEIEKEHSDET